MAERDRYPLASMPPWLKQACAQERHGDEEGALDLVYQNVDQLLREHRFDECDAVLAEVPPHILSTDLVLGLLTVSFAALHRLPSRRQFFLSAAESIAARGEMESGLLDGLED